MQLANKKLNKKYNKYVSKNKDNLIDDYCKEIKNLKIGDLTLNEYTKYRFFKYDQESSLQIFYRKFQDETKDYNIDFDSFCRWTWAYMDEAENDFPDDIRMALKGLKIEGGAEA